MPKFQRERVELHYELDGSGPPVVYISGHSAHSNDTLSTPLRGALAERYTGCRLTTGDRGRPSSNRASASRLRTWPTTSLPS
jgi:hypothetical protein